MIYMLKYVSFSRWFSNHLILEVIRPNPSHVSMSPPIRLQNIAHILLPRSSVCLPTLYQGLPRFCAENFKYGMVLMWKYVPFTLISHKGRLTQSVFDQSHYISNESYWYTLRVRGQIVSRIPGHGCPTWSRESPRQRGALRTRWVEHQKSTINMIGLWLCRGLLLCPISFSGSFRIWYCSTGKCHADINYLLNLTA